MKTSRIITLSFIILLSFVSCKKEKKEAIEKKIISKTEKVIVEKKAQKNKNRNLVNQKENIFEINQSFSEKNGNLDAIGEIVNIDLLNSSGAMISAYSENKGNYSIYFRTLEKNSWSNWIKLEENKEVQNSNREVFSPKSLNNFVTQIQFKSNQTFNKNVVFRIFTFKK
ncbi:MAG: hypothetical protein ACI93P_002170 [bacterium]|jgi:hypothetical protein